VVPATDLRDRTVLVTDATDGLGRALAASLAEVRRMAAEIRARETRLDVLVNNAGIGTTVPGGERRLLSADGHELRFAVNYLAGYLLTRELLGLLRASAPARIVDVSSAGQMAIDFDDVMLERGYSGVRAYCQSKLAEGVGATLRLVADPALRDVTGAYFDGTREARAEPQAYDAAARRRLAELSAQLVA
jgi:NAD(P)-dependent dehydrogenase (short-subunit alcohol dehydrogenase family)